MGHCLRSAHIGTQIGRKIGLSDGELNDLYYALMLKDLGCSANAALVSSMLDTDDTTFKRALERVDGSKVETLLQLFRHAGKGRGLAGRARAVAKGLALGSRAGEMVEIRCRRGAEIACQMRFSEAVGQGILDLDEHFDGSGRPHQRRGEEIHLFARIALLAQVTEIFFSRKGPKAAISRVRKLRGKAFDPTLVDVLLELAARDSFWSDLASSDLEKRLLDSEPGRHIILADEDYLDDIVEGFSRVIDAKSPFTAGHSSRVADITVLIARELGLDEPACRNLRRAALLHDIGKLGVSARILNKPTDLDAAEWEEMRSHACHSERILSRISAFSDLAEIGGAHHERLDGTGYPRGLKGDEISFATRIVATADVFDALTADRPYRAAMPHVEALSILKASAGRHHDPVCVAALERVVLNPRSQMTHQAPIAQSALTG
ncbi:HD domain-containing protein [Peteryoungia desertarenae]|uniref:HD domain-containing protein n=2 Tax=Peteryoungia desertarenae TaxID=1813451 RepID=A0ABX6QS62_9HYPH|nr:HD domain-containing protein [Peteryoungia desertarenae]